jgi:acetylornithine deacetylase/succinyl-diaminopimelate desuccinylase-like protein
MATTLKERILKEIEGDDVLDLAKALVRIPSYTTDETPVARYLHEVFRREGLVSKLQEVDPGFCFEKAPDQTLSDAPGINQRWSAPAFTDSPNGFRLH